MVGTRTLLVVLALAAVAALPAPPRASGSTPRPKTPSPYAMRECWDVTYTNDPAVIALSKVADYDIFRNPVMVQCRYSRREELTVLIWAAEEGGYAGKRSASSPTKWEIRVLFPDAHNTDKAKVIATGAPKRDPGKGGPNWGRVVAVAAAQLEVDPDGRFSVPVVIYPCRVQDQYSVEFTHLPRVVDGFVDVVLSKDLKSYSIHPGA
jgi:hypothetical protein